MVTTKITVPQYQACYMYHLYVKQTTNGAIHLPSNGILYHMLHKLTTKRPKGMTWKEEGNLELILPNPEDGKSPMVYNYLNQENIQRIRKFIDNELRMELYEEMKINKRKRIGYLKTIRMFCHKYGMEALIEEGTLFKGFQRFRGMKERKRKKRIPKE